MRAHKSVYVAYSLTTAAILLFSVPATAMHPAPFTHKHFRRTSPPPPVQHPRREVEPFVSYYSELHFGIGGGGHFSLGDGEPTSISSGLGYGAGFEILLGWRMNQYLGLDLTWTSSFHRGSPEMNFDHAMLSELAGSLRIILLPEPGYFEPYAQVGLGLNLLSRDGDTRTSLVGAGFLGGFGIDFHLNPIVTLGLRTLYRGSFVDSGQQNSSVLGSPPHESAFLNTLSISGYLALGF
jgi:opacity protein-like surface antigen